MLTPPFRRFAVLTAAVLLVPSLAPAGAPSDPVEAARAVTRRVAPRWADQFDFETIPAAEGRDVFEIASRDGRTVLRGTTAVALASAFNRFVETYGHGEISWNCGNQLKLPPTAPAVKETVRVVSPHRYRYTYNYCTHGYTAAWWRWPQWEHELDFLALKGVNLALIIQGQEQVWIEALARFGYTADEVRRWVCAPSHQPWQYMSNIEYYGGPLSPELVAGRRELGRQILARMSELGIQPVLQGYYGIVPSDFKTRFPQAKVHPQGDWAGLKRPDMLDPLDPMFAQVAAAFYAAQRHVLGPARFFAADPFHEGGLMDGIDLAGAGRAIQAAMKAAQPDAVWVLQSWLDNPRQPMVDALDRSHVLVLDLNCEARENWRERHQFGHTPWLWCTIENYGGNTGLGADLAVLHDRPARALAESADDASDLRGIGALMEGSESQPVVWELFFAHAWTDRLPDLPTWLRDYGRRRYGADSPEAVRAWEILRQTVYSGGDGAPLNSVLCARPTLEPYPKARLWGTTQPYYDTARLVAAWESLLSASHSGAAGDGYRYDIVDVGRQVLADLAGKYHRALLQAYAARDAAKVTALGARQQALLADLDELLATRREFLLGPWLRDARDWGNSAAEKDRLEQCARELVTTWNSRDSITDYANRQWSGLVGTFYVARWRTWTNALQQSLASGRPLDLAAVQAQLRADDLAWTRRHDPYPTEPHGDSLAVARNLLARYRADATAP